MLRHAPLSDGLCFRLYAKGRFFTKDAVGRRTSPCYTAVAMTANEQKDDMDCLWASPMRPCVRARQRRQPAWFGCPGASLYPSNIIPQRGRWQAFGIPTGWVARVGMALEAAALSRMSSTGRSYCPCFHSLQPSLAQQVHISSGVRHARQRSLSTVFSPSPFRASSLGLSQRIGGASTLKAAPELPTVGPLTHATASSLPPVGQLAGEPV
jgi:hypothetical protein